MQIEFSAVEIAKIVSKYAERDFSESDVRNGTIDCGAAREAILCEFGIVKKDNFVGKTGSFLSKIK